MGRIAEVDAHHHERRPLATAPEDHDPGPADAVLALQATAGNRAVQMLLRQPRKGAGAVRDVASMSDEMLERERDRLTEQIVNTDPMKPEWERLRGQGGKIDEEIERRRVAKEQHDDAVWGRERAQTLMAGAEAGNRELKETVEFAQSTLEAAEGKIAEYLGYYTEAYNTFASVLGEAKEDAARRDMILSAVAGLVMGTGIGLAAGLMFRAAQGVFILIGEVAAESAELAAGKAADVGSQASFEVPEGIEPAVQASEHWQELAQAWKAFALLSQTVIAFGDHRVVVERAAGELGAWATGGTAPRSVDALVAEVVALQRGDAVGRLRRELEGLWTYIGDFSAALRHPLMRRLAYEIEQDLWITWIANLRGSAPADTTLSFPMPPIFGDPRVTDALDENAIEDHLHRIGVLGEGSRLGVDFGINTTPGDTMEAYESARVEQRRMQLVGRLGVAVSDIPEGGWGMVHLRHDVYLDAKKPDPAPSAPALFVRARPWVLPARRGQVVSVEAAPRGILEVRPLDVVVAVTPGEEAVTEEDPI